MYEMDQHEPDRDVLTEHITKGNEAIRSKLGNKGYFKITRPFKQRWTDGKYHDTVTIEMYASGDTGTFIRHAVTGERTKFRIGSADQDLFFIVTMTGVKGAGGSFRLFYDSPTQYENHQYLSLDAATKEKWHNRVFGNQ